MIKHFTALWGAMLAVGFAATSLLAADAPTPPGRRPVPKLSTIDNGVIRLGIDLELGGAITYLSPAGTNREINLINSHDWGRQVQLSYYSGPVPFHPPGTRMSESWKGLGWNPIQSGDCFGFRSKVLAHTNDGHSLYVKCVPMQWPLENVPGECECEVWLTLDGPVVHARCRLTNHRADTTQYPGRNQELPAVYVNAPFHRLMTYCGDRPFTGAALTNLPGRLDQQGTWAHWTATENWAAEVNDTGWGLGVWNPGAFAFDGGFFGEPGGGGPLDDPTGYIGPTRVEILDPNIVFEYRYELILGTVAEIRDYVYAHAHRPKAPAFRFERDRQSWHYNNATDTGWPIRGQLDVQLGEKPAQIVSPIFFARAEDAPRLVIEAAFDATGTNAAVFWRQLDEKAFSSAQSRRFAVSPDGRFHRYEIPLAASPEYRGAITQLRFDPPTATGSGGRVRLKSVIFEK